MHVARPANLEVNPLVVTGVAVPRRAWYEVAPADAFHDNWTDELVIPDVRTLVGAGGTAA